MYPEYLLFDFCKRLLPLPVLHPGHPVSGAGGQGLGLLGLDGVPGLQSGRGAVEKGLSLLVEQLGSPKGLTCGAVASFPVNPQPR